MSTRIYTKPLKGHKLTLSWCGEYGVESSSTASCVCGWQESASSQGVCRFEYRQHLRHERVQIARAEGRECKPCRGWGCGDCEDTGIASEAIQSALGETR